MDSFVARQPIFDRRLKLCGYELLFRSGPVDRSVFRDATGASAKVICDSTFVSDLGGLTRGHKAFVNVTGDILTGGYFTVLPHEIAVVEILETVKPDAKTIAACETLKLDGYEIAFDDFVGGGEWEPFLDLADYVKIDFLATTPAERKALVRNLAPRGVRLLAEKIETHEAAREASEQGFHLFQGFFFRKPELVARKDIPTSKLHLLQLLAELNQPSVSVANMERLIKRDLSFSFKLLRFVNSTAFGLRSRLRSIRQALVYLGDRELNRWASLVAMAGLATDCPEELLVEAVTRARFCELLAGSTNLVARAQEAFLLGMLSSVDAVLGRPLDEILPELPLPEEVVAALLGGSNKLRTVYECSVAYESGNWDALTDYSRQLGLDESRTPSLYREAVAYFGQRFCVTGRGVVHATTA